MKRVLATVKEIQRGNNAFEGAGEHDDLVIGVALACWWPTAGLEAHVSF